MENGQAQGMDSKGERRMITLYNGDFFEVINYIKSVDVTFTSPPYNRKRNDKYANYDDTIDDYFGFIKKSIDLCLEKTKEYTIFNLQANYYNRSDVYKIIGEYADIIQNIVIWEKKNPLPASGNNITNAYEYFLILGDKPLKSNTTYTKNHITTAVNTDTTTKIHRAVMKQEVSDWFIEKFTQEGQTVLDCFMGLGTTGISCKSRNRNFIGVEKDKTYFDIASKRIDEVRAETPIEEKARLTEKESCYLEQGITQGIV